MKREVKHISKNFGEEILSAISNITLSLEHINESFEFNESSLNKLTWFS